MELEKIGAHPYVESSDTATAKHAQLKEVAKLAAAELERPWDFEARKLLKQRVESGDVSEPLKIAYERLVAMEQAASAGLKQYKAHVKEFRQLERKIQEEELKLAVRLQGDVPLSDKPASGVKERGSGRRRGRKRRRDKVGKKFNFLS